MRSDHDMSRYSVGGGDPAPARERFIMVLRRLVSWPVVSIAVALVLTSAANGATVLRVRIESGLILQAVSSMPNVAGMELQFNRP